MNWFLQTVRVVSLSLAALAMYGQSFGGRIVGLVADSSAAPLSNVSVTVINEGTGAQRQLITDASGSYAAAELPVGYYTLRFEAPRMGKLERQRIKVDVGSEARADVVLNVEAMQQSIDVTAQAPVLQQGSSSLTEVVETRRVEDLPLNGRDFRKLAFLVPGAAPRSPAARWDRSPSMASAKNRISS